MDADRREMAGRVHSAAIHVLRLATAVDDESGLSPARLSALSVLVFGGSCTLGELAKAEGVRSPTMTRLVSGLEADGLARRLPAPGDARQVLVEATDNGRRALLAARDRRLDVLAELLGPATDEEARLLDRAAAVLDRLVREHGRPPVRT